MGIIPVGRSWIITPSTHSSNIRSSRTERDSTKTYTEHSQYVSHRQDTFVMYISMGYWVCLIICAILLIALNCKRTSKI